MISYLDIRRSLTILVIGMALSLYQAKAQREFIPLEKFGVPEGLAEESIRGLVEDDHGWIWIASENEPVSFDGYDFEMLTKNPSSAVGARILNSFGGIIKGRDGKIWIGSSRREISSYDPEFQKLQTYLLRSDLGSVDQSFPLFEDLNENIWFTTFDTKTWKRTLVRLHWPTGDIVYYDHDAGSKLANPLTLNYQVAEAVQDSSIWIVDYRGPTRGILRRWNNKTDKFEIILYPGDRIPGTMLNDTLIDVTPARVGKHLILCSWYNVFLWDPIERVVTSHFPYDTGPRPHGFSAFEDNRGFIWLVSTATISKIEPTSGNRIDYYKKGQQNFQFGGSGELKWLVAKLNTESHLWLFVGQSSGKSFLRYDYDKDRFTAFDSTFHYKGNPRQGFSRDWLSDFSSTLWVGRRPYLYKEDARKSRLQWYGQGETAFDLPSDSVSGLLEDRRNRLWVATANGLVLYHDSSQTFTRFQHNPRDSQSISANYCEPLIEDHKGNIWIGTRNGLNMYDERSGEFRKFYYDEREPNRVIAIGQDHQGRIWSSVFGKGIFVLDPDKPETVSRTPALSFRSEVREIYNDKRGNIWFGDGFVGGLYRYVEQDRSFKHYFFETSQDRQILWITEDAAQNLWVGTDNFLHLYIPEKDSFEAYGSNDEGFFSNMCFHTSEEGDIWVGNYGGAGLVSFDPISKEFKIYGENEGMSHNGIISEEMPSDKFGNLYLSTSRGLSVFNKKDKTFTNFDEADGFRASKFPRALTRNNGEVWIGSPAGLNRIVPEKLLMEKNEIPPKVWITSMTIMDSIYSAPDGEIFEKAVDYTDEIELDYWQKDLQFDFVALHYLRPDKNQYSWKLEGYDDKWTTASYTRTASYTNLSSGTYTFRVRGSNADGIWNEEGDFITIVIHPPFWMTASAYVLYAIVFFGLLYTIYRWRVRSIKAENLKLEALVLERTLQLEEQAEQLKELDQAKTRFFANISHEFRTPLTLIRGPLKKMMSSTFTGDAQAVFQIMYRNANRLLRLINQLLDISKLEAGKMELKATQGDLVHFTQMITANYTSLAESKQIKYHFHHRQETLEVWFDPDKVEKIITNLLSNAFKFTPNGGEVTVYLGQQDDQAEIEVKDTGIGIPPEDLDKIFDRFHQVDATHTREQEGTGIGMTLVKELVELHQGTIAVKSEVNKGTTFTLLFPLGKDHLLPGEIVEDAPELALELEDPEVVEALQTAPKEYTEVKESDRPHILIAEDNPDMRTYIREALEGQFNLSEAVDGQEGWEKAQEAQPDLIISDVMMPRMDGIELCEKLKTHELTSHIPVILLTAKADRSSRLQGLETGADDYLAKPFDEEELLVLISNRIEQRRRMRERFKSNINIGPKEVSVTSADQQFLEKAMAIVEENMSNDAFSVDDLAQEVGMSNRQLQRKFNALVDQSPNQFIRTMRLRRAAQLLTANSDSVSQIAYQVGFSSLSYFNKAFKEEFDMTPGEYAEKGDSVDS